MDLGNDDKTLANFIANNLQQTLRSDKVAQAFYRVCIETAVESAFDKSSLAGLGTLCCVVLCCVVFVIVIVIFDRTLLTYTFRSRD